MKDEKTWPIIYIPDKPMAMPNQQPTVEVHACLIEPKHAHTIVRRLNHIAPLEDLRHIKRVQKKNVTGGKTELTAILCLAYQNGSEFKDVPQEVQELIESYQLIPFITKTLRPGPSDHESDEYVRFVTVSKKKLIRKKKLIKNSLVYM